MAAHGGIIVVGASPHSPARARENGCGKCAAVYVHGGFSRIFADGFDLGTPSAWSLTEP